MNLARLNHVLIPGTKAERDRMRRSRFGRWVMEPAFRLYLALSVEGRGVLLLALLASAAGMDVHRTQGYWLASVLFGLLGASLCVRRLFALPGVGITVECAQRVMVGQAIELRVRLRNAGPRTHHSLRFERPILPWDGAWTGPAPALPRLGPDEEVELVSPARFVARGHHHLDPFVAAALAPGRLSHGPAIRSNGARFVVVPRIAPVTRLDLPPTPRFQPGGISMASKTGESMELQGLRAYQWGDPIRDLHAVTWARVGHPVVRVYEQEYFSRIGIVLDTDMEAASEEHLEASVSLAAGVVAHLTRSESLIDLLVSGQELHRLTVGRSLGTLDQALDHLACVSAGPTFCADVLEELLRPHLERLSAIVFVALALDSERQRFVSSVRVAGVGVRTLVVCDESADALPTVPGAVSRVSLESIRDGEALAL